MSGGGGGDFGFSNVLGQYAGFKGNRSAAKGAKQARKELGTPPIFWGGGPWWDALTSPNNLLAQNAKALLSGNGLTSLEPALRSADLRGQDQQRQFSQMLSRSGLIGSGAQLGGNQAIANQTGVNKQNILAQLPNIQRENIQAMFPYFSRYLSNQEFRAGGLAGLRERRGNQLAAYQASIPSGGTGGKGGGNSWQGPGGQTAPAGK